MFSSGRFPDDDDDTFILHHNQPIDLYILLNIGPLNQPNRQPATCNRQLSRENYVYYPGFIQYQNT